MSRAFTRISLAGREGLPRRADVVMAGALSVLALLDLWVIGLSDGFDGEELSAAPFAILVPATLAWRRRRPVAAAYVAAAGLALQGVLVVSTTSVAEIATMLVLAFSLGAHASTRGALAGLAALVAAIVTVAIGSSDAGSDSAGGLASIPFFAGIPCLAGMAVRAARGYAGRLERLSEQLERERERSSRLAVAEERAVIARELHDVVSSGVGVMTVQAAGAGRIVERDPRRARDALAAIESAGRSALVELERMLAVMRTTQEDAPTETPGLGDLASLASRLAAGGLDLEFTSEGAIPAAAPALELAVYRIVQEALTNAMKHAGGARVRATVRYEPRSIEVEVVDDGDGHGVAAATAGGHGLIGMRERVALFRGEFDAGPGGERGFRVHARLPVPEMTT